MKNLTSLVILTILVALAVLYFRREKVDVKKIETEIIIAGKSVRTTNKKLIETNGAEISSLLQSVFAMRIPNLKPDATLFIIYSDYDNNFKNDYQNLEFSVHVGFDVSEIDLTNKEIQFKSIQTGNYKIFETKEGKLSDVVFEKWQEIWKDDELLKKRVFKTDFEAYQNKPNPENGKVNIYIGIK